ncbi:DMT family transporter [Polymorphobacter sp.]|uniref:DMT family transporter n=1 Tax=Polymorphobacter sp. TaxID=1909290 RepID=UPI003F70E3F2
MLITLIWAFNIVAIKYTVDDVGPLTAVTLRYGILMAVCLPWLRWQPGRMGALVATGLVAGALFMGLGALSFAVATNISAISIAGQLGIPFSLLLGVFVLKERIRWPRILAVTLSVLGVIVMGFDPAIVDEGLALWLMVAAAVCWAVSNLMFRSLADVPMMTTQAWLALVSTPVMAAAAMIFEPHGLANIGHISLENWSWLFYSAVLASLVGHGGMSWLFQRYPVATVSPLSLPTPLLSVFFAVTILGSTMTNQMMLGGALTLIGVAIITLRTARVKTAPAAQP